jgi:hypothetical protein
MQNSVQVHAATMDNGRFFLPILSFGFLFFCIGMFIVHSSGILALLYQGEFHHRNGGISRNRAIFD